MAIFTEYHIEHPMKPVLDSPVSPQTLQQGAHRHYSTGDEIPFFHFHFAVDRSFADDHTNGFQAFPQLSVPNLGEVRADVTRAFFLPPPVHLFGLRTSLCSGFARASDVGGHGLLD